MSKKLTKRELILMTITLIFLVVMAFFKFLYLPEYSRYQESLQLRDSYDTEVQVLKGEKTSNLPEEALEKQKSLEEMSDLFGTNRSDDEIEKELREVLSKYGYTLDTFFSSHHDDELFEQVKENLKAVGVRDYEVAGTGVYAELPKLLEELKTLKGYSISELGIVKKKVVEDTRNSLLSSNLDSSVTDEEYSIYLKLSYLYEAW